MSDPTSRLRGAVRWDTVVGALLLVLLISSFSFVTRRSASRAWANPLPSGRKAGRTFLRRANTVRLPPAARIPPSESLACGLRSLPGAPLQTWRELARPVHCSAASAAAREASVAEARQVSAVPQPAVPRRGPSLGGWMWERSCLRACRPRARRKAVVPWVRRP